MFRESPRLRRTLAGIDQRTAARIAAVQAEEAVQREKVLGIGSLSREAVTNVAMLERYAQAAALRDPVMYDALRLITEVARMGQAEMVAHLVDHYCREH
jgi:hypothetical protein